MRVETEFKERSTQLSFRARRRPQMRPTFPIGGRGIPLEVLVLSCDRSVPSTNVPKVATLLQMRRKLDWTNRFNALDSLDTTLYCAIEEFSLKAKEGRAMLSRCANPDCGANFDYGHGRFFRFRRSSAPVPANSHSVQHHWLCDSCSETYTLDYREAIGILLSLRFRTPNDGYIPLLIAEA